VDCHLSTAPIFNAIQHRLAERKKERKKDGLAERKKEEIKNERKKKERKKEKKEGGWGKGKGKRQEKGCDEGNKQDEKWPVSSRRQVDPMLMRVCDGKCKCVLCQFGCLKIFRLFGLCICAWAVLFCVVV